MCNLTLASADAHSVDPSLPGSFVTVQVDASVDRLLERLADGCSGKSLKAAPALFFDIQTESIRTYILDGHIGCTGDEPLARFRGGLSTLNLHLAQTMLSTRHHNSVTLVELGSACGLSPGHFAREFKRSTGLPPHRWALSNKISMAKDMLLSNSASLPEIAIACGFVDQAHLSRWFKRMTAVSPKAWQRLHSACNFSKVMRAGIQRECRSLVAPDDIDPKTSL